MQTRTQNVLFILLGVVIALTIWCVSWGRTKGAGQVAAQNKRAVPEIVSCVKNIRVVKAELQNPGTTDEAVAVEVENTTAIGIIAISIESEQGPENYTVVHSAFQANAAPTVVLAPQQTDTLLMAVMFPNAPVRIGAVLYADGTEEGCAPSLKMLREAKADALKRSAKAQKQEGPPK